MIDEDSVLLLAVPRLIHMAKGNSEGHTPLTAFDNALLDAGVHNVNLMRVSSIIPKDCRFGDLPDLPVGTLVPTVYAHITSSTAGETISACIGGGIGSEGGVLMEYHHRGNAAECERVVQMMIEEGFEKRGWELQRSVFVTGEHTVDRLGSAVAVAMMLDTVPVDTSGGGWRE